MNKQLVQEVNDEQLRLLDKLAKELLKRCERTHPNQQLIVPFIGAGASRSAGLPMAPELKETLHKELVGRANKENSGGKFLEKFLEREANYRFPQKACNGILGQLTLFEYASVVSQFKWCRDVIPKIVSVELRRARCRSESGQVWYRPLAYELLAHLAKHEFIDHLVSVNFDELLDDALKDEIPPDQLYSIGSSDDLPGPAFILEKLEQHSPEERDQRPVFLFKPFGSLSRDIYRLTPEDTKRYGSESV